MTDDLETLRQAVEAFGRRKNELSEDGKVALKNVTFNLKRYMEDRGRPMDERDERVMKYLRKLIDEDLAIIAAELSGKS
jgi:hemerythrin-like domain-containing protein